MLPRNYTPELLARRLRTCPLAAAAALIACGAAPGAGPDRPLCFVADGGAAQRFDLWSAPAAGDAVNLTQSEAQEYDPALSPDGTRIVFGAAADPRERRVDLWVMNADGSGRRRLTRTGQYVLAPSWSPDGKRIAFSTINQPLAGAPEFGMRVIDADGANEGTLGQGVWAAWSPDGARLLSTSLNSARGWEPNLIVAKADGSDPKPLGPKLAMMGAWSPDGSRIAYAAVEDGRQADLFVMDADGSNRKRLTRTVEFEVGPQWSADGRRVAFTRLPKDQPARARIWSLEVTDPKAAATQVSKDRMEILGSISFWLLGVPGAE